YFLVDFPQEPGALRGFLHDLLGPDDDVALFEYTKRNNRETGPALVGIELGSPEDLQPLLERMERSPVEVERIPPDSPLFRFILGVPGPTSPAWADPPLSRPDRLRRPDRQSTQPVVTPCAGRPGRVPSPGNPWPR